VIIRERKKAEQRKKVDKERSQTLDAVRVKKALRKKNQPQREINGTKKPPRQKVA